MATGGVNRCLSAETCQICFRKEVQYFCIDCSKSVCVNCLELHTDYTERHAVIGVRIDVQTDSPLAEQNCEKHPDKTVELYCPEHYQLICYSCGFLEHKECKSLRGIAGYIAPRNMDSETEAFPDQLRAAMDSLKQNVKALGSHLEEQILSESNAIIEIDDTARRLITKIEDLKGKATNEVVEKRMNIASDANKIRAMCVETMADVNTYSEAIEMPGITATQMNIMKMKRHDVMRKVGTLCREAENMTRNKKLFFSVDWRMDNFLRNSRCLCRVDQKYRCLSVRAIHVREPDEPRFRKVSITGCCLHPDGTVYLSDCLNTKLKRVDPATNTVLENCDLHKALWGLALISPQRLAVCAWLCDVICVNLGAKMVPARRIDCIKSMSAIACSRQELFVTDPMSVNVHDLNGTHKRKLFEDVSVKGIALDESGERVYLAVWNRGLVCTDRAGHEVFRRSNTELGVSEIYDVVTDQRGNLLVCGHRSNNVVQVTEDGRVVGEILTFADGVERPQCMCYDKDNNRLYVGGCTANLMVFDLALTD